ncbi:hypothetical protein Tco_0040071 [Tanacetum coccineum]
METCKPANTPMVEKSKLDEVPQRKAVDPTCYGGMIGNLMYPRICRQDADHAGCQDTKKVHLECIAQTTWEKEFNIFTNPLARERLEFLIKKLGVQSMSPETLKRLADEEEE